MRKLSPVGFSLLMLILGLIAFWGTWIFIAQDGMEPKDKMKSEDSQLWVINEAIGIHHELKKEDEILIQFLSVNYLIDKEYLMRVEIDGEQIGVIYFDEKGEIRFDGDKEKFEEAIFKAFDARRVK